MDVVGQTGLFLVGVPQINNPAELERMEEHMRTLSETRSTDFRFTACFTNPAVCLPLFVTISGRLRATLMFAPRDQGWGAGDVTSPLAQHRSWRLGRRCRGDDWAGHTRLCRRVSPTWPAEPTTDRASRRPVWVTLTA
jgi:hypothetical protein